MRLLREHLREAADRFGADRSTRHCAMAAARSELLRAAGQRLHFRLHPLRAQARDNGELSEMYLTMLTAIRTARI